MNLQEKIRFAYQSTCQSSNGYSLEDCLKNVRGEKTNTVCEILRYLRYENSPFDSRVLSSDAGVGRFIVTYKFGEFEIIVKEFMLFNDYPFDTVETLAKWLENQEKKILATATLLTTQ